MAGESESEGASVTPRDPDERIAAELRASEERLRATLDGTPEVAVQWYDLEGRVRLWNRASERMFGFSSEEALGRTLDQLILPADEHAEFLASIRRVATSGQAIGPVEIPFRRRDGAGGISLSTIFAIPGVDGSPFVVCMDVDLTERKRVEAELRQAQKEEVLGRLAGGMAHDFNNLLTAIVGFAELGRGLVGADSEAGECFRYILESAQRGATLTGNLLAFARKRVVAPRTISLREVVDRLVPLMRPLIGETIELTTRHDHGSELVQVDVGSIEQVLMNLIINARDAMPTGGRIKVETRAVSIAKGSGERIPEGRYVELSVTDTGAGVPPEVQPNVFEPFFTTKDVGQGTGLGLAMSAGIVRQAGGHIGFESDPERGTTFRVHLPVADKPAAAPATPSESRERPRGDETLLLVEDDLALRRLLTNVLGQLGYRVLAAEHGRAALEVAAAYEGRIDLLVSDVIMPEMGGLDLADALRERRPETRLLLISGYTADPDAASRHSGILAKPFSPSTLARRVREVLDG